MNLCIKVGEDDYHQLKHDQCLRVDFKSFPKKFIELLESCRGCAPDATILDTSGRREGSSRWDQTASSSARNREREGTAEFRAGEPSFLARLETAVVGGFSVFSLVETNPFKELTHLSLKFRAGNDTAIKTYLAARLRQVRALRYLLAGLFRGCCSDSLRFDREEKVASLMRRADCVTQIAVQ